MDTNGNVYVGDQFNNVVRKVMLVGTNWVVTTLAGLAGTSDSVDGTGSAARFDNPWGTAVDSAGNVYVAEPGSSTIRKVTPAGAVTTLAGLAYTPGSTNGTGRDARSSRGPGRYSGKTSLYFFSPSDRGFHRSARIRTASASLVIGE